jgi:osmotically inducible lipoprotein OsmB
MEASMRSLSIVLATAATLALGACGTSQMDRGISGAAIGAGTGAAASAITGGSVGGGALLGGAVGAAVGLLTDAGMFNFGEPVWRR